MGDMSELDQHIDAFLARRSANTNRVYRHALALWRDFEAKGTRRVGPDSVGPWLASLQRRKGFNGRTLSENTIQRYFWALHSTYSYLRDIEVIPDNPFAKARRLMNWRQLKQVRPTARIPEAAIRQMLALPDKSREGARDRAILALLFGGALRRSEALGLKISDLEYSKNGIIYMRLWDTKAGKTQDAALPRWASKSVYAYMKQRLKEGGEHLLVTYWGRRILPMSQKGIYRIFRRYAAAVGVSAAPHAARAAACTRLRRLGADMEDARILLRHSGLNQIRVYDQRDISRTENPALKLRY